LDFFFFFFYFPEDSLKSQPHGGEYICRGLLQTNNIIQRKEIKNGGKKFAVQGVSDQKF